jgi:hypothetical protein
MMIDPCTHGTATPIHTDVADGIKLSELATQMPNNAIFARGFAAVYLSRRKEATQLVYAPKKMCSPLGE